MTIAPMPAWPRRRTPWLSNRFGRRLLWPGALNLRLRTWAANPVVERWRKPSMRTLRSERRYSLALSVVLGAAQDHLEGRPVGAAAREVVHPTVASRTRLAARRLTSPESVPPSTTTAARLETLASSSIRRTVRAGSSAPKAAESQRMLVATAPPRVLARGPRSEPAALGGRDRGGRRREPAAQRGTGVEANRRPPDIERLTDSVMAAIDRRLWSHRERMGRR